MARALKLFTVIVGLAAMFIVASLFVRMGEHDESTAITELLAIPVPPWCVKRMEGFSAEWLRDPQSGLVHVEGDLMRYPYVGAVLLIRPVGESIDVPRLAFEAHHRHCGIQKEFIFFGPEALQQGIQSIRSGDPEANRRFLLEVDGSEGSVRVVPLPSNQ